MSPLQRIAMGLVIVLLSALVPEDPTPAWAQYDLFADPVGWALAVWGLVALVRVQPAFALARTLGVLAALVSVPLWFPQVSHLLDESGQWAASLPQIAFSLALAREIGVQAGQQRPRERYVESRFGLMLWGFGLVAVLPVLVLGGGLDQLRDVTAVAAMVVNAFFVYCLFRVHRREWLGGPGPLLVEPAEPR